MPNINANRSVVEKRKRLFEIGIEALEKEGWRVEKVPGAGKPSLRRIRKEGKTTLISIRTTQDTWIAFPRDQQDEGWTTLSDVDLVLAVSVDDKEKPRYGQAHLIDGKEMRERFDRAYKARLAAGHAVSLGSGSMWVSLYHEHEAATDPVNWVGGGAGLTNPAIYRAPLERTKSEVLDEHDEPTDVVQPGAIDDELTINEAKRRLALTFGIDPSSVKIVIEA